MKFAQFFKQNNELSRDQWRTNDDVRSHLASLGDDGAQERTVLHYFYPKKWALRKAAPVDICTYTDVLGYTVLESNQDQVIVEGIEIIAGEEFDRLTQNLKLFANAHGWDYDGWECPVMIGEDIQHNFAA